MSLLVMIMIGVGGVSYLIAILLMLYLLTTIYDEE